MRCVWGGDGGGVGWDWVLGFYLLVCGFGFVGCFLLGGVVWGGGVVVGVVGDLVLNLGFIWVCCGFLVFFGV